MTQGERIKLLRKELKLSQEEFGDKLGVRKTAISRWENEINSLTEQATKSICRTFNVDYFWLTEGVGEMFTHFEDIIIEQVTEQYNLDKTEKAIVLAYLEASKETRTEIKNYILELADRIKKESDS